MTVAAGGEPDVPNAGCVHVVDEHRSAAKITVGANNAGRGLHTLLLEGRTEPRPATCHRCTATAAEVVDEQVERGDAVLAVDDEDILDSREDRVDIRNSHGLCLAATES